MSFLDKEDYLPQAPMESGSVRVNHSSPMCNGSSKSLKITREDDGTVKAKCYRCGQFGSERGRLSKYGSYAKRVSSSTLAIPRKLLLPKDFTSDISEMPAVIRAKLSSYSIEITDILKYGLGWSKSWERFIFPVYRDGGMVGFQAKYFYDDSQPKYITRYKHDGDLWLYLPSRSATPIDGCAIVEDMFSGIRCAEFTDACVLFGTEMGAKCLDHVANSHKSKYVVFLDDDNNTVKKKAIKIRDSLTMVGRHATIFHSDCIDPKEYDKTSLKDILEDTLR